MCWNEQGGLFAGDAPRVTSEVVAVRAKKMVKDVEEKAESTKVFKSEIDRQQTLCPSCGKPAGEGKFCVNCGTNLQLQECYNCGEKIPMEQRFCGECGTRLQIIFYQRFYSYLIFPVN